LIRNPYDPPESPALIRFGLQMADQEQIGVLPELDIKMGGCRPIALDPKAHQPLHAHSYCTADAA
jgi:hypothetical protein